VQKISYEKAPHTILVKFTPGVDNKKLFFFLTNYVAKYDNRQNVLKILFVY